MTEIEWWEYDDAGELADAIAGDIQFVIESALDAPLPPEQRAFLYMPFMHSESAAIQAESVRLFTALGQANNLDYAQQHQVIVDRFGRFPHRNAVLGRESTPEEAEFLKQPGSSF